jgi:hypothetical protein
MLRVQLHNTGRDDEELAQRSHDSGTVWVIVIESLLRTAEKLGDQQKKYSGPASACVTPLGLMRAIAWSEALTNCPDVKPLVARAICICQTSVHHRSLTPVL